QYCFKGCFQPGERRNQRFWDKPVKNCNILDKVTPVCPGNIPGAVRTQCAKPICYRYLKRDAQAEPDTDSCDLSNSFIHDGGITNSFLSSIDASILFVCRPRLCRFTGAGDALEPEASLLAESS